jgi:predicted DNA-binding transcriptional regulator YafY
MAAKAMTAMQKILSVLPPELRHSDDELPIYAPDFTANQAYTRFKEEIRRAIKQRNILHVGYRDASNEETQRHLEPLGLVFWGKSWTLIAHCLLRDDYRMFRLDRISELTITSGSFSTNNTKSMQHYLLLEEQRCQQYRDKEQYHGQ